MTPQEAFFTLHKDLPREGPGNRQTLDAAMTVAGAPRTAAICDAGCGPGADIEGLLEWCPEGSVLAVDTHAPFVEQVSRRYSGDPRVTARAMDMRDVRGPFDLIWCAGAMYFLGVKTGLELFRKTLRPAGTVIFSEPCLFEPPLSSQIAAFWQYPPLMGREALIETVQSAGYAVLDAMVVPDAAWEAYFGPIRKRADKLRAGAPEALLQVIAEAEAEEAGWRAVKAQTGYLQIVARRT